MSNRFYDELRRRGVISVAAIYIITAWLIIQVADVFFPAWDVPEIALRYLLTAAILGLPIALVFGWKYDVTSTGIRRTPRSDAEPMESRSALRRADHLTIAALAVGAGLIVYSVAGNIIEIATDETVSGFTVEKPLNSVAVLPFTNISDDAANEYFCDGISEEILHRLSEYREIYVLARTSSFAFKGSGLDATRLSDILGVRYLLQGSVRKVGDELRISAQLVDEDNFQVWSNTYDRKLSGVFAIQSEIAAAVAESLANSLSANLVRGRAYQPNIDAYLQFLLGREYLRARTPGFQTNAIKHFDTATAIDENYAAPHAGRAIAMMLSGRDSAHYADRLEQAERSIAAALSLDSELAIGFAARGLLMSFRNDDVASEQALRNALALDPNLIGARNWLGNALQIQGRSTEALAEWENALARDPLDPVLSNNLAARYRRGGDFHRAEKQIKRLLDLPRPPEMAHSSLFHLYDSYGRYVDMIAAGKRWVLAHAVPESEPHYYYAYLSYGYQRLGMNEMADYWQNRAENVTPIDPATRMRRAYIYRLRGLFENMEKPILEVLDDQGLELDQMPPFIARVVGAVRILTGRYEAGIGLMEPTFDFDEPFTDGSLNIDFIQTIAYGHKKLGNYSRVNEILAHVVRSIEAQHRQGYGRDPDSLAIVAQNHAVEGDLDAAIGALEIAIAGGFRHYFFVIHDPRWDEIRTDGRFQALMLQIKADIDAQRALVEQIDAEDNFAELLDQKLARHLPN